MSSRGRTIEIQRLHAQVSRGGNCFTANDLQKFIGIPVNTKLVPKIVYLQDMHDGFQEETLRLEALESRLREDTDQYSIKKDVHNDFFNHFKRTKEKGPEKFDLIVESATDLPCTSSYFIIKKNGIQIYKSLIKSKTNCPVWIERYTLGTAEGDQVWIQVWNSDRERVVDRLDLEISEFEDQLVHHRQYDLQGPSKLRIKAQYCHNQILFHKMYAEKYELMLQNDLRLLQRISDKLYNMFTLTGIELLRAWFGVDKTYREEGRNNMAMGYESYYQSKVVSLVSSPNDSTVASRYNRPIDLAQIICVPRSSSRKGLKVSKHGQIDFLSVGLYKATRAQNQKKFK